MVKSLLFVFLIVFPLPLMALDKGQPLPSIEQELHAKELFHEFRCVVCQSESVADSPAEIAQDIRHTIRLQIAEGKSDVEIKAYLVSRYGDFILMRPPFSYKTWFLWAGPALLFLLGALGIRRIFSAKE